MINNNIKKQKPIQIFSNKNESIGINVVKSPVKLTILEMLRTNEMEFDEIVNNTGKSKSTISVHLKSLRENGIISFRIDPTDNRKKIFFLRSRFLGAVNVSETKDVEETKTEFLIDNIIDNDGDFSTLLLHTLRAMLIQEGINIDPILHQTGVRIGEAIYKKIHHEDLDQFLANLIEFWDDKGLGKLTAEVGQVIKITSIGCFECGFLPKLGKPACYLDVGILEALFTKYFQLPMSVIEVQCYTMGDEKCTFEIEPLGSFNIN